MSKDVAGDVIKTYWPIITAAGGALAAMTRLRIFKALWRSIGDRISLAMENTDLRKRFAVEVERGDYWESRCDELERRFQEGLREARDLRTAIRRWKNLIIDLTIDREAAMAWGTACADELSQRGVPQPMERPAFLTAGINIVDPLQGGTL